MDTKTLVVGQDVRIESGVYGYKGRVLEVGPRGLRVQTESGPFWFDSEGKGCDGRDTFECGPWYITYAYAVSQFHSGTITVYCKNHGSVVWSFETQLIVIETNKGSMCHFDSLVPDCVHPDANYYTEEILNHGGPDDWFCLSDTTRPAVAEPGYAYVKVSAVRELLSKK